MPVNEVTHSQKLRSGDFYDIRGDHLDQSEAYDIL